MKRYLLSAALLLSLVSYPVHSDFRPDNPLAGQTFLSVGSDSSLVGQTFLSVESDSAGTDRNVYPTNFHSGVFRNTQIGNNRVKIAYNEKEEKVLNTLENNGIRIINFISLYRFTKKKEKSKYGGRTGTMISTV